MRTAQVLASIVLLACVLGVLAKADVEPNNSRQRAEEIGAGTYTGNVSDEDEKDVYAFTVRGGDVIHITLERVAGGDHVDLCLLDHEAAGLDYLRLDSQTELVYLTPAELGEWLWFLEVSGEGPYQFTLDVTPQNDGGQGVDAPEDEEDGLPVQPGEIRGMLGNDDEADVYRFPVAEGQTINVEFQADFSRFEEDMSPLELALLDYEEALIENTRSAGQVAQFSVGPIEEGEGGEYKLLVSGEGDYRILLQITGAGGMQIKPPELKPAGGPKPIKPPQLQPVPQGGGPELQPSPETPPVMEIQPKPLQMQPVPQPSVIVRGKTQFARIVLDSLYCQSESSTDRLSDSDEPYLVVTAFGSGLEPRAWSTGPPEVFGDVDSGENRRFTQAQRFVYEGNVPEGTTIGFCILVMENDDWPAGTRASLATRAASEIDEEFNSISPDASPLNLLPHLTAACRRAYNATKVGWESGPADDWVALNVSCWSYAQLHTQAMRSPVSYMQYTNLDGGSEGKYWLRWHLEYDQDASNSFEARFTHWDELAVADIMGGPEAEIMTVCDEDASGNMGLWRVYNHTGRLLATFATLFTPKDRVAIGNVLGGEQPEIVVANDDYHAVQIFSPTGASLSGFDAPFSPYDGLGVGNVLGDARDEIIIARDDDNRVLIYDGTRTRDNALAEFQLTGWNFDGARYTNSDTRHDAFLVGDVAGDEHAEIVMIDNRNGPDSQVFIYNSDGTRVRTPFQVVFTRYDAAILADVAGDAKKELVITSDDGDQADGCITRIYDFATGRLLPGSESQHGIRCWPIFTRLDGFAAGDVLGTGKDQIILATDDDNRIYLTK